MSDLRVGIYWAWVGFLVLATSWGATVEHFAIPFWWNVVGATALMGLVQILRWWERRRALSIHSRSSEEDR